MLQGIPKKKIAFLFKWNIWVRKWFSFNELMKYRVKGYVKGKHIYARKHYVEIQI